MQTRTRHLPLEHSRSPYEKSAVTSCVKKTLLSNLRNINPKVMNKSKSAFLALVCRGTEDSEMLTGLGIEIRSLALVKAKNSPRFWGSLDAASMNFRERSYSGLSSSFPVAPCVLSSLDLNPLRDEAIAFLWDDWTRAWSILHLRSFSQSSDAFMSPAFWSQQCLSFLTLFINLCTLRYPTLSCIHHIVVGCPSRKPL